MSDLHALDLDVTVERERARRLVDRFGGKDSEGGELARERRAHRVSAGFRKELGERLNDLLDGSSRSDGPSSSIARLEAALNERWRKWQQEVFAEAPAVDIGAEQMRRKLAERSSLLEGDLNQESPGRGPGDFAAEVPAGIVARSTSAFEALKETLDDISVKSVLDFRSAGAGVLAAEAVATAAACLVANIDDTVKLEIMSLNPDCPWEEALQVLGKPGHFINALRRFPYAVDLRKVPEDNAMGARHYVSMAEDVGGIDSHPAVRSLHRWVMAAISYWSGQNPEDADAEFEAAEAAAAAAVEAELSRRADMSTPVPTPARATASTALPKGVGSAAPPAPKSAPSSFQPPSRDGLQANGARAVRSPNSGSESRPRSVQRQERPAPGPRASAGAVSSKTSIPKARPSASPRTRPSTSNSTPSTPGHAGTANRPAGSPQPQRASLRAGVARQSSVSTTAPASATSPSSTLRPAASPHPRQGAGPTAGGSVQRIAASPGPRTGAAPMGSPTPQQQRSSLPAKPGRSPMRPTPASRGVGSGNSVPAASPSRPAASPRRTGSPRRNVQSPRRSPPPPATAPGGLSTSKSTGSLGRASFGVSTAAGGVTTLATRGVAGSQQVATPGPKHSPAMPPPQSAQSIQEWRRMLEETKKEVREIKAIESQMKWNLQREEKKQRVDEEKEVIDEIRDWRWRESDTMKAYVAEKAQEIRVKEIQEAKGYQEFKRETKAVVKEEEQKVITEQYLQDLENSKWRAEQIMAEREKEKEAVVERIEDHVEMKEMKVQQKNEEKLEDYENRVFEQNLEMLNLQREIAKEKEQVLASLELTRQAQRNPMRDGRSSGRGAVRRLS